jgi:hypothetical protein
VPIPVALGSLTAIVTVMGASPRVTSTDVADTVNEVRVGRMSPDACRVRVPRERGRREEAGGRRPPDAYEDRPERWATRHA